MFYNGLGSAVYLSHLLISEAVRWGGTVIDATAGNGNDTIFLAKLVGPEGRVFAFDTQEKALQETSAMLEKSGCAAQVTLINAGHEDMDNYVQVAVDVVIFNLGYLPGGDHNLVTSAETTTRALSSALKLLRPGGRIGIVVYTGHPGGREECEAVELLASSLDSMLFNVISLTFVNRSSRAPVVIVIEKAGALNESKPSAQNT